MANDHAKETLHPPPKTKGKSRLSVSAKTKIQSETKRIEFDFDKYAQFLEDADLSESEKLELCKAVWNIMSEFVMLGFGVHPIQQACGKDNFSDLAIPIPSSNLLSSEHKQLIAEFDSAADGESDLAREGVEA